MLVCLTQLVVKPLAEPVVTQTDIVRGERLAGPAVPHTGCPNQPKELKRVFNFQGERFGAN